MRNKKRWIITGAAALLLAGGGVGVVAGFASAPITHEDDLKVAEEQFGKAPAMPTEQAVLKEQLEQLGPAKTDGDWEKAELLKQQIAFAEHAPSPMPTGHESVVVAGKEP